MERQTVEVEKTENYTKMYSNFVPNWVTEITAFKARVKDHFVNGTELKDVKFYNPLNVSNNRK